MGTNYYVHDDETRCPYCGRGRDRLHIGKSSFGWCFSLHVIPEKHLNSLEDWLRFLKGKQIKTEYGDTITATEMEDIIINRGRDSGLEGKQPHGYGSWKDFHISNHSEPGPNGLLRHQADGTHCIGHGPGTWDLIAGVFS